MTVPHLGAADVRRPLRVLFAVVQGDLAPGSRYRVFQYLPHLEAEGLACTVMVMQSPAATARSIRSVLLSPGMRVVHNATMWVQNLVFQWRLVRRAPDFDRIVLYRLSISIWTRWWLRSHGAGLVTDFDDALDTIDADGEYLGGLKRWMLRRGLQNAILASAVTIASNEHNRGLVERLARPALVIPTSIDVDRVPFRDRRQPVEARLVIGWMGTPSTALYLVAVEAALRDVARQRDVIIRLVGAERSPFRDLKVDIREWTFDREPDDLRRIDIGIMPMPDTAWTRGKAATKALQYGASGAPTVASLTATNVAILGEREGALFAQSSEEWVTSLLRLIDDPDLRSDTGRRARARVAAHFSVGVNAPRLARIIRAPHAPAGSSRGECG